MPSVSSATRGSAQELWDFLQGGAGTLGQSAHYLWDWTIVYAWDRRTNFGILHLRTRAARHGHDYDAAAGALTLPELARILADAVAPADSADPAWLLHAIHRTGPTPTDAAGPRAYLIELAHPATAEARNSPPQRVRPPA